MNDIATLKNKLVFFLGVNTGFVRDGIPDERFLEFYRERSSKDLYCAILGNIVVPRGFGTNAQTPELSNHPQWNEIANAISVAGSLPGIQLATTWPGYVGQKKFVLSDPSQTIIAGRQLVSEMTRGDITDVLNGFWLAARMAVDHGYRHIQVHAAHGYLPSLLLDRDLNPRSEYVQEEMSKMVDFLRSQKIETSLRWSLRTGDHEFDQRGITEGISNIAPIQFDFIDLSSGYYNIDKRLIYPSTRQFLSQRHEDSLRIAYSFPKQRFIVSGRIFSFSSDLPENVELGICRDLIANPNFLVSHTEGCQNRGKCHYHSRGSDRLTCGSWDENSNVG